jgi:hypothetical protein
VHVASEPYVKMVGSALQSTSVLRDCGLVVNTDLKLVICARCTSVVGPQSAVSHLSHVHKAWSEGLNHTSDAVVGEIKGILEATGLSLDDAPSDAPEWLYPSPGDPIPLAREGFEVLDGFSCTACSGLYTSTRSFDRHLLKNRATHTRGSAGGYGKECKLQRYSRTPQKNQRYVKVTASRLLRCKRLSSQVSHRNSNRALLRSSGPPPGRGGDQGPGSCRRQRCPEILFK